MYWAEVRLTNGRENSGGATHRGGGSRGSMVHAAVSSRRGLQATSAGTQLRRPQRSPAAAKYERQRRLQWSSAAAAPAPASPALHRPASGLDAPAAAATLAPVLLGLIARPDPSVVPPLQP